MDYETTQRPIYEYTNSPVLLAAVAVVFALLLLAFGIVWYRQRRQAARHLQAQWHTVREIADEKEISAEEWRQLEHLIRTHAPTEPLQVATVRRQFDACVDAEMAALGAAINSREGEQLGQLLRDIRMRLGLDYIPIGQRITHTRDLIPGQTLWVAETDGAAAQWHRTTVTAVDEAHFYLAPIAADPVDFVAGATLRFRLYREEDARYVLTARLLEMESAPNVWKFEHSRALKRLQSRAHYRLRHEQPVEVSVLASTREEPGPDFDRQEVVGKFRGRFSSLSGGGYALILPQDVPPSAMLRFTLVLDEEEPFSVTGRVVDCTPLTGGRFLLRGAFVGLGTERRDQITRYIFRKQQHQHPGDLASATTAAE